MKSSKNVLTEKDFLKYICDYGCHVVHVYNKDEIRKTGSGFTINNKKATAEECATLISLCNKTNNRNKKLNKILKN